MPEGDEPIRPGGPAHIRPVEGEDGTIYDPLKPPKVVIDSLTGKQTLVGGQPIEDAQSKAGEQSTTPPRPGGPTHIRPIEE